MTGNDVKDAITAATNFLKEIFPEKAGDVRLEEVERSEDGKFWLVTLSFGGSQPMLFGQPLGTPPREYKVVEVDAKTGEPRAVKIRVLQ